MELPNHPAAMWNCDEVDATDVVPSENNAMITSHPEDDPASWGHLYGTLFKTMSYGDLLVTVSDGGVEELVSTQEWVGGYVDWAVPRLANPGEGCSPAFERMMRMMMRADCRMYGEGREITDRPPIQLRKMFAAPIVRLLKAFSETNTFTVLGEKMFVLMIELSSEHTTPSEHKVWRLVCCHGDQTLDSLHDQIIAPAMGWRRHYHAYKFIAPGSGAEFGPQNSDAIDMMHECDAYTLDSECYEVRHLLRKKGDRLGYVYDLGDYWKHIITVIGVVDKGSHLGAAKLCKGDPILQAKVMKHGFELSIILEMPLLLAGACNCPPEDSVGCDQGEYGQILNHPTRPIEERGVNWQEHGIYDPFDFCLSDHQERFDNAVTGRKSPADGTLTFSTPFSSAASSEGFPRGFLLGGRGRKTRSGHTVNALSHEVVGKKRTKHRCANCSKQHGCNGSLKLFDCSRCHKVAYCGRECQAKDWPNHKRNCKSS